MKAISFFTLLSAVSAVPINSFAGDPSDGLSDYAPSFGYQKFQALDIPAVTVINPPGIPASSKGGYLTDMKMAFKGAQKTVTDAATTTYHYVTPVYDTIRHEAADMLNRTKETAQNAVDKASGMVQTVSSDINNAAYHTKTFIIHTKTEAEGFFSSTFKSVKDWFTNLGDEVKDLLHFLLRAVEVTAVLVILIAFLWILKRVTSGYKFLKSVANSFELHDRTVTA